MESILEPYRSTKKSFAEKNLIIRPSKDDDFEAIVDLMFTIYKELCPPLYYWYKKSPETFKIEYYGPKGQDPKRRVFYTIENLEKQIIGCAGLIQYSPKKIPDKGEISKVYLLKNYRGKGLGRIVVEDLIRKARELDFKSIYLTSRIEFDIAINLYKRLGFKKAKKQRYEESKNSISLELKL